MREIIICSFFYQDYFLWTLLHCCYLTTLRRTLQGCVQYNGRRHPEDLAN
jgi:hypothetical protein